MKKMEMAVNVCASAAAAVCCAAFGGWDIWMRALLSVMVTDYITGVMAAFVQGSLSSRVGAKGICKKVMILCIVALAVQLDSALGAGTALRSIVMGFYLANDALSITENMVRMGVPAPKGLVEKLEQMKSSEKE